MRANQRSILVYGVPAIIGRIWRPGELSGAGVFCLVFLPFALGHYLSSLLRNINAILAPQLVAAVPLSKKNFSCPNAGTRWSSQVASASYLA